MIIAKFQCDGCDKVVLGTDCIRNEFHSISGKGYGFGQRRQTKVEEIIPEGWIAYDPYTQMTYCPKCWDEIVNDDLKSIFGEDYNV